MGFVSTRSRSSQDNIDTSRSQRQDSAGMPSTISQQGSSQGLFRRTRRMAASSCGSAICLDARENGIEAGTPRVSSPLFTRGDRSGPPVMDQDKEHLLIAAGAIGAFILFSFMGWIVYRMLKKAGKLGGPQAMPFESSPWAMRNGTYAQYPPSEPPSMYDKAEMGYGGDKMYTRSSYAYSGGGTLRRQIPVNPQYAAPRDGPPPHTADDRAIDQYYNDLFAAHPPQTAQGPAQRPYRMSDVSSLSSGFGDGEFVVTQPLPVPPRAATSQPPAASERGSARYSRPPSWTSQSGSRRESRRETVYTTTSEDRPARFRTLSSWVNQQSGRVKRADSRAQERGEIPVMPAVPGEMSFTRQTAYR